MTVCERCYRYLSADTERESGLCVECALYLVRHRPHRVDAVAAN